MPIELAGISNENEFYSEHYLATVFEGDVQETFREWREAEKAGDVPPNRKLEKIGTLWRRLQADYRAERNDGERLLISRKFAHSWLDAMGYERRSELVLDAEGKLIPVLARRVSPTGRDLLWVVEVLSPAGDDFSLDPLQVKFRCEQFENMEAAEDISQRRKDTAEAAITKGIFALDAPPRFVILLSMSQVVLVDRLKWSESRLLRFTFEDLFGRGDATSIGVVATLTHVNSLAPDSGTALIDRIDEESHRHAYGVSKDLKFALREAIELLGNEAASLIIEKRRAQQKGVFTGSQAIDPERLTTECLRYMYRLLFLFFIEARPELGFAPMKAKAYRTGYSLEGLRELEMTPLETDEDRNGHYISDSLDTLFRIVFDGTPAATLKENSAEEEFSFAPVRARLFSPAATETYLGGLRFRNATMQRIIALLSLSKGDRARRRGRISYAQLGISQLGAVYEALLSFSGFFAAEDLIELKPAGKPAPGPLEAAFFAPQKRAKDFKADEIVYDGKSARVYPKGTFIYRLSGRNRENTAAYYTPEPLARVLVKYALKDLLAGKKADDILKLKVIEPAMGSAAFLVEVINQLADKYLELKQAETKKRIPHERYAYERQRVRAFLADRNVFGVDLNPVAVELGQVSLWLNCLHEGGYAPWFEDQVHAGNSLVGARRAAFPVESLSASLEADRWYKRKPREIGWGGEPRRSGEIWHFLLPDPGMSAYNPDIVRPLASEKWETFFEWRRAFNAPLDADEIATLKRLSGVIDVLFKDVADRLEETRREVNDEIAIWPAEPDPNGRHIDFQEKLHRLSRFHGDGGKSAVSWRRLRTTMDSWAALWFWPIDKADLLPSRATFLNDIALVLEGRMGGRVVTQDRFATGSAQGRLFETVSVAAGKGADALFRTEERIVELSKSDLFGDVDVDKLIEASNWLPTAMEVATQCHFMHFDLEFADVMRERGGFDLVIGNPPWLRPDWIDAHVLSEREPAFGIRNLSADAIERLKPAVLAADDATRVWYLRSYAEVGGLQSFLSSAANYPFISGGRANLYKCFIDLAFRITSPTGASALIHQDNHLTDPNGGEFRRIWYARIRRHYNFMNEITAKMFAEVDHRTRFSLNIYSGNGREVLFDHMANVLLPTIVDESYEHDGIGPVPGLRLSEGGWDTRGHRKRIVQINRDALQSFASVIEQETAPPETTRFLFPFSTDTLAIFQSLASRTTSFADASKPYQMNSLWNETNSTKKDHILEKKVAFPSEGDEVVLTGSLLYVGNPFYKCAVPGGEREPEIDLDSMPNDYRLRTYYRRVAKKATYRDGLPALIWDKTKSHADLYRIAFRNMLNLSMERTLVSALIPPGAAHVHTIESLAFADEAQLVSAYPLWLSLPFDFIVKTTGQTHFQESSLRSFPWAVVADTAKHRALRLSCLTVDYADLWNRNAGSLKPLPWSQDDSRLSAETPHDHDLGVWTRRVGLRSDYARRLALVEIDVLVAQALGLTVEQLIEMYRTQFHVLKDNERGTWYDASGRIVWTCSRGTPGIGFRKEDGKKPSEREWREHFADLPPGKALECEIELEFLKQGPKKIKRVYEAPFTTCDREADYRRAWGFFEAHKNGKAT